MVSETDVVMAYRLLMGREPENQQVVTGLAGQFATLRELRAGFMTSPEFRAKLEIPIAPPENTGVKALHWPFTPVDVNVPPDILEQMIRRIEQEFVALGSREPHWSVLTEDRFKAANIGGNESEFYASGQGVVTDMHLAAARCGVDMSPYQSCFELGCGLGRSTIWLARQFARVTGGDISTVHLALARQAATAFDLPNISFAHLNQIRRYRDLPPFDVFFSIIVLQHNPPPLMAFVLETILTRLAPGGIAYFQIPTYIVNYAFSATDYLGSECPDDGVEVHCLPQAALFGIMQRTGCEVLEIREDGAIGALAISNRLFVRKRER